MSSTEHPNATALGRIWLPTAPGQPVGRFQFLVNTEDGPAGDAGRSLEVGGFVAVDTPEGVVIGTVTDMHAVGSVGDPISADLSGDPGDLLVRQPDATLATATVLHSRLLRPVRAGMVRYATAEECKLALGQDKMKWPVPVGAVRLGTGELLPICLDGVYAAGPEAAGILTAGKSGLASKSSFQSVAVHSLLQSAQQAGESVAVLFFNCKGTDYLFLDDEPTGDMALQDVDHELYQAMGITPKPFEHVTVYAPSLPGGTETSSPRRDARRLRWDLPMIWSSFSTVFPGALDNDNLRGLLADMKSELISNPSRSAQRRTVAQLEEWFQEIFEAVERKEEEGRSSQAAWKSHHVATVRKASRMISSLVPRFGGLLHKGKADRSDDIPTTGWTNGDVTVVDIAGLTSDIQGVVVSRTINRLFESAEMGELGVDRLIIVCDEMNQFAPKSGGQEFRAVRRAIHGVSSRGRYSGIALVGACQMLSAIDDQVTLNASTKVLGTTDMSELTCGLYGQKLPTGFVESVLNLRKGQMALWHYTFRQPIIISFPRPAWAMGRAEKGKRKQGTKVMDVLQVSDTGKGRLLEGVEPEVAEQVIAAADDPVEALQQLKKLRVPDLRKAHLHEPNTTDEDDPFDLME